MHVRRFVVLVVAAAAVAALAAGAAIHWAGAASKSPLAFGHAVVVDHQRVDGEPSLSVSPTLNKLHAHDIYVSAPYGFSTTASFVWKSEDGGKTFHLIGDESPAALGKPAMTCAGGGDSSIVNDKAGNFYFADLQALTNVSDSVSTDGGNTFTTTCNSTNVAGSADRPWLAVKGNPLTTGSEYMTVDNVEACDPDNCGLGQTGANVVELTAASGTGAQTQTFSPLPALQIEPDGIVGGIVANQKTGAVYIVHTGFTDGKGKIVGGSDANGNDNAVVVDAFPKGYSASVATPIPPGSISVCKPYNAAGPCSSETVVHAPLNKNGDSTVNNGQDFSVIAIDTSGNLYVTWAQSPVDSSGNTNGPTTVYLATSSNGGKTWTKPIDVSGSIPGLRTNVFPWLAAGSKGRVDIVWYGTKTLGNCKKTCGAGFINASWNVYMAQTLNAVTGSHANSSPTFSTTKVTEYPNHYGSICEFGLACTTGGDRGLIDFINVQALPNGAAGIVWADGANTDFNGGETSPVIAYAQQTKGPSLYAGKTIKGAKPRFGSAAGSKASYYAADGSEIKAGGNMRILKSSVKEKGKNYIVTMKVKNLNSLSVDPSLGGTDAIWLTRWETQKGKRSTANQGHVFFAAMESDGGGAPSFYVGESVCGVASSHCKGLTYPPSKTIKGKYTKKGTIRLVVPVKLVGGDRKLFSITGLTATQTAPGSSGTAIFNVIDSTAPYNVK